MGFFILLIIVGLAACIVWLADWTSGGRRAALAALNRRFVKCEIDLAEYEEKRKLIVRS